MLPNHRHLGTSRTGRTADLPRPESPDRHGPEARPARRGSTLQGDGALAGLRPSQRSGDYLGGYSSPPRQASPVFGRDPSPPRSGAHWTDQLHQVLPSSSLDQWIAGRDHQAMGHPMPPAAFPHRATHVSDPYGMHGTSRHGGGDLHDWIANRDDRAMGRPARPSAFPPASPPAPPEAFSFNAWRPESPDHAPHAGAGPALQRPMSPPARPAGHHTAPAPRQMAPLDRLAASCLQEARQAPSAGGGPAQIDLRKALGAMETQLQADMRRGMRSVPPGSARLEGVDVRLADAFAGALKELGARDGRLPSDPLVTEKALQQASRAFARQLLMEQAANEPAGTELNESYGFMFKEPPPSLEARAASLLDAGRAEKQANPRARNPVIAASENLASQLADELKHAELSVSGGRVVLKGIDDRLAAAFESALQQMTQSGYGLANHHEAMRTARARAAVLVAESLMGDLMQEKPAAPQAAAGHRPAAQAQRPAGAVPHLQVPLEDLAASFLQDARDAPRAGRGPVRIDFGKALHDMDTRLQVDLKLAMLQAPAGSVRLEGIDGRLADAFGQALEELGVRGDRLPDNPLLTETALQRASGRMANQMLAEQVARGPRDAELVESRVFPRPLPSLSERASALLAEARLDNPDIPGRSVQPSALDVATTALAHQLSRDLEKAKLSVSQGRIQLEGVDERLAEAFESTLKEAAADGYQLSRHDGAMRKARALAARKVASQLIQEQRKKEMHDAGRASPAQPSRLPIEQLAAHFIEGAKMYPRDGRGPVWLDYDKAKASIRTRILSDLEEGMRQSRPGSVRLQGVDARLADAFASALKEVGAQGNRLANNPLAMEKALRQASAKVTEDLVYKHLMRDSQNYQMGPASWTSAPRPQLPLETRAAVMLADLLESDPQGLDSPNAGPAAMRLLEREFMKDLQRARPSASPGPVRLEGVDERLAEAAESALREVAAQGHDLSNHQQVMHQGYALAAKRLAGQLVQDRLNHEASEARQRAAEPAPPRMPQRAAEAVAPQAGEFSFNAWLPQGPAGTRRA